MNQVHFIHLIKKELLNNIRKKSKMAVKILSLLLLFFCSFIISEKTGDAAADPRSLSSPNDLHPVKEGKSAVPEAVNNLSRDFDRFRPGIRPGSPCRFGRPPCPHLRGK